MLNLNIVVRRNMGNMKKLIAYISTASALAIGLTLAIGVPAREGGMNCVWSHNGPGAQTCLGVQGQGQGTTINGTRVSHGDGANWTHG